LCRVPHHALLGLEARAVLALEAHAAGHDQGVLILLADLPPELAVLEDAVRVEAELLPLLLGVLAPLPELLEGLLEGVVEGRPVGLEHLELGVGPELVLEKPGRLRGQLDVGLAESVMKPATSTRRKALTSIFDCSGVSTGSPRSWRRPPGSRPPARAPGGGGPYGFFLAFRFRLSSASRNRS
jgi:hypothetical protein